MRKSISSILGIISVIGFIGCGESAAMRYFGENSQESVYNNSHRITSLSSRSWEERNETLRRENDMYHEWRASVVKGKIVRALKWSGIGFVGLFEGVGRTLGVLGGLGFVAVGLFGAVALCSATAGFSLPLGAIVACMGAEMTGTLISAPSITKYLVKRYM